MNVTDVLEQVVNDVMIEPSEQVCHKHAVCRKITRCQHVMVRP